MRDRGGAGELLADLPVPNDWPGLPLPELERRAALLAEIRRRVEEDGPRRASAGPGRGRLFIPFAALRGYEEMIAEAGGGTSHVNRAIPTDRYS